MEENLSTGVDTVEAAAPPSTEEVTSEPAQEENVPLSALQAERKQRQEAQQNLKLMQDHLELIKANQSQRPKESEFGELKDDDILTVGEAKKHLSRLRNDYQMSVEELKMQQTFPDYEETVRKYLPDVLKEDPDLRVEIENAKNPYKLAYTLAKRSTQSIQEKAKNTKSETADRIIENSKRPGSLSAVGSTTPKSQMRNWKNM
ncbi:hypothetical protein KAR91_64110, partial [Candidatus Pacearchaeota archaeon]|nr:hypothetical protein [Candidatus Pacearchaeota archaeon]